MICVWKRVGSWLGNGGLFNRGDGRAKSELPQRDDIANGLARFVEDARLHTNDVALVSVAFRAAVEEELLVFRIRFC
jgi:hypothetical protein